MIKSPDIVNLGLTHDLAREVPYNEFKPGYEPEKNVSFLCDEEKAGGGESVSHKKPRRRPEKIHLRVTADGHFIPADPYAASRLREKKYRTGDLVAAQLSKLRNLGSHKNAHKIALMMMRSHDDFRFYANAHDALKRLQIESGAACEEIMFRDKKNDWQIVRLPLSFSFDSLGEEAFLEAVAVMCRFIAETYWPEMDPEEIDLMSERMPLEAA